MSRSRNVAVALGAAAVAGAAGYVLQRAAVRRWQVGAEDLVASGRALPGDLRHHFVPTGDGGRIHVVERGDGPPLVLVPGVTLTVATWVPQLRGLADRHRVIAVDQRGHGQSLAGDDGYSMERLADDLLEVLGALDVTDAVLAGHSMGGMVALLLAVDRAAELARHVAGLALVATAAGPFIPSLSPPDLSASDPSGPGVAGSLFGAAAGALSGAVTGVLAGGAEYGLRRADRRGRGLFPGEDIGTWLTRVSFGARPAAADVGLVRTIVAGMSPSAMAELLGPMLAFDVHRRIHAIELPTRVVVGSRDVLTPPRMARVIADRIPDAELTVWPGCGHTVMLERPAALGDLLHRFSSEVTRAR